MRNSIALLALSVACAGDSTSPPPGDTSGRSYEISGVVEDSLLGVPLSGIRVTLFDSFTVTDAAGRFAFQHPSGRFDLTVADYEFAPYATEVEIFRDQSLRIRLQGSAPYLLACFFDTGVLTARILDLQGRKTINRRSQSIVTLVSNQPVFERDAYGWYWTPVDNLTWLAHVPHGAVVADTAIWRLEDADGFARVARCIKEPPPCESC